LLEFGEVNGRTTLLSLFSFIRELEQTLTVEAETEGAVWLLGYASLFMSIPESPMTAVWAFEGL
jgi:hypothetical protein